MAKPRKKKYSDAKDALSAFGGEQAPDGEPPAQQPPQAPQVPQAPAPQPPAPEPIQAPPPAPPSPQLPADQLAQPGQPAQATPAPPARPQRPISPDQRPAIPPQIPDIPKVSQPAAQPPLVVPAGLAGAARRPAARRTARRPAARRPAARRRQPKAIDPAAYTRMQTAIPPLLATGALVLILATVLAVKLPSGKVDDPTHMTMPPHPMLANPATKWIVLSLFPVGAGLLFGAFMLALQVGKLPPPQDQAGPRPRRYDTARPTRRR